MTAQQIARMNAAIESLEIDEGIEMEITPRSIPCVKTYLKGQQRIVNLGGPGAYPAFRRVVEIMKKLKE